MEARKGKGQDVPISLDGRQPFKRTAQAYLDAGWLPMPLPPKRKEEPPTGFTGWDSDPRKVNQTQVKKWLSNKPATSNICNRAGHLYLGIDVDAYKAAGDEMYAAIIEEIGEFPETYISSARADGKSGIRHYRLPEEYAGMKWPGTVGEAIQFVHIGQRYAVLPPSRHPEDDADGNPQHYRWYEPGEEPDGSGTFDIPPFDDLAELSVKVIEYFTKNQFAKHLPMKEFGSRRESDAAVKAWTEEHGGEPCSAMIRALDDITGSFDINGGGKAAHNAASDGLYRLACLAAEAHAGFSSAVSQLEEEFYREVGRDDRDGAARSLAGAQSEWARFRDFGIRKVMFREEAGEFIGSACRCAPVNPDGRPKPDLNVNEINVPVASVECYEAMAASPSTDWQGAYRMGGTPFVMDEDGLYELTVDRLREEIMDRVNCFRWKQVGDAPIPVPTPPPSQFLASMVVSRRGLRVLPELTTMATTPFYALVDNKPQLIHENGYHQDAKVYLDMDPELQKAVEHMSETPSENDLYWAKQWIAEVIQDFPFTSKADRAGYYAALILPFARELIAGPTPIHLFLAPVEGTGKGLLADVVSLVATGGLSEKTGRYLITMPKGSNKDEEMEKKIVGVLRANPKIFQLDNVTGTIDSPPLAAATTSEFFSGRLLGRSEMLSLPNRCTWLMTGNNFQSTGEISRRIVPTRIDAQMENPSAGRTFEIDDLPGHVKKNRARLVWACLVLIAEWVAQGQPSGIQGKKPRLGSHREWERVIGGILAANGIKGFLDNLNDFRGDSGSEYHSIVDLLEEWEERIGLGEKTKSREVLQKLLIAQEMVDSNKGNAAKSLGMVLSKYKDVPQGKYVLRRVTVHKEYFYRLEIFGQPTKVRRGRPKRISTVGA